MMNMIERELKEKENYSITENGAIGYRSSVSALVDLNYNVSSLRDASELEIKRLFDDAFYENPTYCLKWLFYARDIREGLGERRIFRVCYRRLFELDSELFLKNLIHISEYGRWDDIISLLGINDYVDSSIIEIIKKQINEDLDNMEIYQSISLLGKWLPSENASSKQTKKLAKKVRKGLGLSSKEYRKNLSMLRDYSNVVEVKMCANKWDYIDYNEVPSLANLKYKNAFLKHDLIRRKEYLESVRLGKSKMNMNVATPVDIVCRYGSYYDETLELAWNNLKDVNIKDTLVVMDGSGSMCSPVTSNIAAIGVAVALAIYTSQHNSNEYKGKFITFSNKPQLVKLDGVNLLENINICFKHNEMSNTNIEKVFNLILETALTHNIPQNEMVKNVLIISDMEFDEAQRNPFNNNDEVILDKPLFDLIESRYAKWGYKLPKLIFWNVNSRSKTIPCIKNELGVILVSGFSQNVLKMVMNNQYNPYDALIEILNNGRYDNLWCGDYE